MGKGEASASDDIVPAHQPVQGPSRVKERRLQKRHTSSRMKLTFLGVEHKPANWSLGGILVADRHPHTTVGTITEGFLDIVGHPGRFPIRIELVRRDLRTREIAFRFIEPSSALLNALSRLEE
jgi:hypothetical protein